MFDRAVNRSRIELGSLRSKLDGRHYDAAGLPWFGTLFGRDAALTAMLTLPFESRTAADTLRLLARYQGTVHDESRDAEPGKTLDDMRRGDSHAWRLFHRVPPTTDRLTQRRSS